MDMKVVFLCSVLVVGCWLSGIEAQSKPPIVNGLSWTFYKSSCPQAESIIKDELKKVFKKDIGQAAGLLRLHFHDCFVLGCDGSVLLDGSAGGPSEKSELPNLSLRKEAFKIVNDFNDGVLYIPSFRLTDSVEQLFRNMQAFEQCHASDKTVAEYIHIMDNLINNEEDIKILVKNGIIENLLEDDHAAATVSNNLGKGNIVNSSKHSHYPVIEKLNVYYKFRRHKWKATLKLKYFNNPWAIISVIAAAILLLLTVVQTVCSILQVV